MPQGLRPDGWGRNLTAIQDGDQPQRAINSETSDAVLLPFRPLEKAPVISALPQASPPKQERPFVSFDRRELTEILRVYGMMVASGEWRDYAIDTAKEQAVFSVFRRSTEMPLFRIEKTPKLARKQGAYAVVSAGGRILKRGTELAQVLKVFDKSLKLVDA